MATRNYITVFSSAAFLAFITSWSAITVAEPEVDCDIPASALWFLDNERSSWSDGTMPPDLSLKIQIDFDDEGDGVRFESTNDTCFLPAYREAWQCKGATEPYSVKYEAKFDGKSVPTANPVNHYNTIEMRRVSRNEFEVRKLKEGQIITAEWWAFSCDGQEYVRRGLANASNHTYEEYFYRR